MKCKKIRELIMTDYLDGEITEELRQQVDEHVKTCPGCRELLQAVRTGVSAPLQGAELMRPPESVWSAIKEKIEERESESVLELARDRFFELFTIRRPVLAVVTVMLLFVIAIGVYTGTSLFEKRYVDTYIEDQMDFLYSLNGGNGEGRGYEDIGIPMEDLLL